MPGTCTQVSKKKGGFTTFRRAHTYNVKLIVRRALYVTLTRQTAKHQTDDCFRRVQISGGGSTVQRVNKKVELTPNPSIQKLNMNDGFSLRAS